MANDPLVSRYGPRSRSPEAARHRARNRAPSFNDRLDTSPRAARARQDANALYQWENRTAPSSSPSGSGGGGGTGLMSMGGAQPLSAEEPAPASEPASPYEPATLESSPVYLELLRKLAFRGDESRRNTESGVRESNMGLTETLRLLGEQGVDQRQGIDNDAESRGVYRSGARLKRNAEQRGREEARGTAMRTATAARIGDLNAELAARLAEMEATRADSELRARETYQSEQARAVMEQEFARRLAALGA